MEQVLQNFKELLAEVDSWYVRCMSLYPDKIACRTGCSGCCRALFDITLLDAFYLKRGFDALPEEVRAPVLLKCAERLRLVREEWPEFDHPYLLNHRPDEEWETLMPEDDETPCVLLDDHGRCLVYDHRPMTCRLHGIPLIDISGEVMHEDWCTMNFVDEDPLGLEGLAAPFESLLQLEVRLFRDFAGKLLGQRLSELDTLIPTALLIDFDGLDWPAFIQTFERHDNE